MVYEYIFSIKKNIPIHDGSPNLVYFNIPLFIICSSAIETLIYYTEIKVNRVYFLQFCTKYFTSFSKYLIKLIVALSSTKDTKTKLNFRTVFTIYINVDIISLIVIGYLPKSRICLLVYADPSIFCRPNYLAAEEQICLQTTKISRQSFQFHFSKLVISFM